MATSEDHPTAVLRRLIDGYQVSQAIHVAAVLGIADLLAGGARSTDDLAAATGAHRGALYRLLRALAAVGVLHEDADRRFSLTPIGEGLRSDAPEPLDGWAAFIGQPYYWQAWSHLLHSVRTGDNAFRYVHGVDPWRYRLNDLDASATFDRAMTALSRRQSASVLRAYDFSRFEQVVDVGGGRGAFLAALLARHPAMKGVLFDQPHVVAGAADVLTEAGVAERCRVIGGDFFEDVPTGGDAYVLKAVIHDWEDGPAAAILRNCRRAMSQGATLLLVERELQPPNEGPEGKFSDLNMLVAPGGQERTHDEFDALLARCGFELVGSVPSRAGVNVIEAVPVSAGP